MLGSKAYASESFAVSFNPMSAFCSKTCAYKRQSDIFIEHVFTAHVRYEHLEVQTFCLPLLIALQSVCCLVRIHVSASFAVSCNDVSEFCSKTSTRLAAFNPVWN